MRATLARQSGSRKPFLRPRRTTALARRPYYLNMGFWLRRVFAYVCTFRRAVVIRVRPAPSFDQYGLLASTACTFIRRLMIIIFVRFQKTCAPLRREAHFGSEAPGPPREARPPKAPQRHSKDAVWVVWVVSWKLPGPPLGGLPAPKGTPKSFQGRGPIWAQ